MKIIAFSTSNSKMSINRKLVEYTVDRFEGVAVELLDLDDYQVPIYGIDDELQSGFPERVTAFVEKLAEADLLIISHAEHNGSYTTVFKNLFDWGSRVKLKLFGTKVLLMSATTGKGGGRVVLESARARFPKHGAEIIGSFSLPEFGKNFDAEKGIVDAVLKEEFDGLIEQVKSRLFETSEP